MSQVDQDKVKDLLYGIVSDIFDCLPDNQYVQTEKKSAFDRIANANLLTDQAPCATVKKMTEDQKREWVKPEPDNVGYQ